MRNPSGLINFHALFTHFMKPIHIVYEIKASPAKVWKALTTVKEMETWSGSPASMDLSPGGEWSLWDGEIVGTNTEIVKNSRLVQSWKEKKWTSFSLVIFTLEKTKTGTRLDLIHSSVPAKSYKSIEQGWHDYYLGPLQSLLEDGD